MRVFLDANILVSVLNKEYPLFNITSRVLSLADDKRYNLYTSPICLAIAFYFAEKKSGAQQAKQKINILVGKIGIAESTYSDVKSALENNEVLDFEDGIQYYAAVRAKCAVIVTEDTSDFYFSEIPAVSASAFIKQFV